MSAVFSHHRTFRYLLTRVVQPRGLVPVLDRRIAFVMLNPSKADEHRNDPTVRRDISFTLRLGGTIMDVVNMYPLMATQPRELLVSGAEPPGVFNRNLVSIVATAHRADTVIVAWGNHRAARDRAPIVMRALGDIPVYCLGVTKDGMPRHPLYVRADAELVRYTYER